MSAKSIFILNPEWKHIRIVFTDIKYLLKLLSYIISRHYFINYNFAAKKNNKYSVVTHLTVEFISRNFLLLCPANQLSILIILTHEVKSNVCIAFVSIHNIRHFNTF